jgi:hypothetical protein
MAVSKGSGKALPTRRSQRKRTWGAIKDIQRFEGVRTLRHQIHCRLDVLFDRHYLDPGEVETTWEAHQSTCDRADTFESLQFEGPGEFGRGRRGVPGITSVSESNQREILEKGEGTDEVQNL